MIKTIAWPACAGCFGKRYIKTICHLQGFDLSKTEPCLRWFYQPPFRSVHREHAPFNRINSNPTIGE